MSDDDEVADVDIKVKRRPFKITGVFDIECASWSDYVVGCYYDGNRPKLFYSGDAMIDHMRAVGGVVFGHAMGVYDGLYVLERARARGISCQVDRSSHRVTRIVMGSLTLRDSYGLWPVPLDDICGALGRPVPRLPWRCQCDKRNRKIDGRRGCGGFCRISAKAAKGDPELEQYVIDDCRALYDGIVQLDEFATDHKIALRGTLGQTAWISAQDEIGVPDATMPWHLWRHTRRADRGGRQAIVRPFAAGPGTHHDICNAYPAQLAHAELPVGRIKELGRKKAMRALENGRPGMYQCTVNVPDSLFLPPLPWSHGGAQYFPTGEFHGTWALPELIAAFERGVSLTACHTAIVWQATAPVFTGLVQRWYEIRRAVGRKTPFGQWIGRLAKALTGKFAEKPDRERVTMFPESIKVCMRKGPCRKGCTKRCGAYQQLDIAGDIWGIPYERLGPSAYPQWSAYLRAMTRIQWMEQAERYAEDLAFGNTDSIWTLGRASPAPLGDGLGQWEYQHAWADLEVRSATCYRFRELAEFPPLDVPATKRAGRAIYKPAKGEVHVRGIPGITDADWKRGAGVLDRGVVTFGAAVSGTRGLFAKRSRRWTLPAKERTIYGDRRLHANGVTYPMSVEEIREVVKARKAREVLRIDRGDRNP